MRIQCGTAAALLLGSIACRSTQPSTVDARLVAVAEDVNLEVVEWGGSGTPVVFLAGLGHTAHVFDEFAPALAGCCRVLGITRRGFGASSRPDWGYDIPTLADDIRIVLDTLGIDRVVLAGHSLGGDEMTWLAHRYPDRVVALVYIEAAYDRVSGRADMAAFQAPESHTASPTAQDSASVEAWRAYYARANGVTMPLSEIEAMFRWTPDGRYDGSRTPGSVYGEIVESIADPDYVGLEMPSLAVYGVDYPITELFLDYPARDSATQVAMRAYHAASLRSAARSREHFRSDMVRGRAVEIVGAGHSLYVTHAEQTLSAIREFLDEVSP